MMAGPTDQLSDKALSVFVFAAYHELVSGQEVVSVTRRDGAGHQADPDGTAELEHRQLITAEKDFLHFSPEAVDFLQALVIAIRTQVGR